MKKILLLCTLSAVLVTACKDKQQNDDVVVTTPPPATMQYNVIKAYPHDPSSFTEGFFLHNNELYESTGLNEHSRLLAASLETGKATKSITLSKEYFGEGIAMLNNKIYQATYREHKIFVYDMNFKKLQEFEWPYEGWGMTTDGKQILLNTGGSNIYFIDPETFKVQRTLGVYNNTGYVDSVNEMEYVDGYIYANRWLTDVILKINAKTGQVEAMANLADIYQRTNLPGPNKEESCLNGIAYDSTKKSFLITGKFWPNVFEVKFN